jgi:cell division protein DivIC
MAYKTVNYQSRKNRRYLSNPAGKKIWKWLILGFMVILLFIFFTGSQSLLKLFSLNNERNQLQKQKEELIKQNDSLLQEIEKLKKDDKYLEKVAREKYNMKKEKEDIFVVEGN